ncbi:hypothetical protein [Microbacterium hibisci]|uniref:hypothetical protein n=1 Tax=Microbacterium hibisci TaxID=2036000 RepID=UPI001EF37B13|nr:hypothetical protein [Microbacterium hibisci]
MLIGLAALIILIVIIASINGASSADDDPESAPSVSEPAAEPSAEPEPVESEEPEPPAATAVERQEWSGTGDMVIDANIAAPATVWFNCNPCESNTVLETNGRESLLVNTIGSYTGKRLINVNDGSVVTRFTITASGPWQLVVEDLSLAKSVAGAASGAGDDVILMTDEFDVAAITNDGSSNFVVYAYGEGNFSPLIVNEIGAYSGTVPMVGPAFVEVTSTGNWSITPQ